MAARQHRQPWREGRPSAINRNLRNKWMSRIGDGQEGGKQSFTPSFLGTLMEPANGFGSYYEQDTHCHQCGPTWSAYLPQTLAKVWSAAHNPSGL